MQTPAVAKRAAVRSAVSLNTTSENVLRHVVFSFTFIGFADGDAMETTIRNHVRI